AAKAGDGAGEGGRIARRVRDLQPSTAAGQEDHIGRTAAFDLDNPVADLDRSAADHTANVDQARSGACQQHARVDHDAVDGSGAAGVRREESARGDDRTAAATDRHVDRGAAAANDDPAATADDRAVIGATREKFGAAVV